MASKYCTSALPQFAKAFKVDPIPAKLHVMLTQQSLVACWRSECAHYVDTNDSVVIALSFGVEVFLSAPPGNMCPTIDVSQETVETARNRKLTTNNLHA